MEGHKLSDEEDRNEKIDLNLTEAPYPMQGNQKHDHTEYDVLTPNNTDDMDKAPENVRIPGTHRHVLCYAVRIAFC